jgi:hypothetical protein
MPTTTKPTMTEQLTSLGESALERLAQTPLAHRALEAGMQARQRVEKLVAGLADLDGRVTRIEDRLDALEGKKPAAKPRKPRTTAAKPAEPEAAAEHEHGAEPEHEPEPEHQPAPEHEHDHHDG